MSIALHDDGPGRVRLSGVDVLMEYEDGDVYVTVIDPSSDGSDHFGGEVIRTDGIEMIDNYTRGNLWPEVRKMLTGEVASDESLAESFCLRDTLVLIRPEDRVSIEVVHPSGELDLYLLDRVGEVVSDESEV